MSDDDRPRRKRSWKEIDAGKDKSGGGSRRRDETEARKERVQNTSAYRQYKSNLDKLFTPGGGGELPESLKAKLGPVDEGSQKKKEALTALRENANADALRAYLALEEPLPDDARLLMQLADLDDEQLVVPVLEKLLDVVETGARPNRMLLMQKIDAIELRFGSGDAVDLARQIRANL